MKKVSILSAAALIILSAVVVSAQSVEEVVKNYVNAVSGGQGFENVNSMKMVMTGELGSMGNMSSMMQGQEMKYTMYTLKPNMFRMEMKVGPMNMVMGNDGTGGWMSMMGRTMDMPGDSGASFQEMVSLYNGEMITSESMEGMQYIGTEEFAGEQCHAIKVEKDSEPGTMYFSVGSGLLMGIKGSATEGEMIINISDYRDVSGYKIPHLFSMNMNGEKVMDMIIEEIVMNPAIDESMFARP